LTFYKIKTDLMYPEAHSQIIIVQSKWSSEPATLCKTLFPPAISSSVQPSMQPSTHSP